MLIVLVRKLLRDIWLPLLVVCILLAAFECLWAQVTVRITHDLLPTFTQIIPLQVIREHIFQKSGKIVQAMIGGDRIELDRAQDMLTIGLVHPLTQTILCIWAVGRAAGAIAGEIERGTMELLLAQPLPRWLVVVAHLVVDLLTIPLLCLSVWFGVWLGTELLGMNSHPDAQMYADAAGFGPALLNMALLVFAVSGCTMWLSTLGRLRGRVMGIAVVLTLVQFVINIIGQLWDGVESLRPYTVFYHYQPQQLVLQPERLQEWAGWQHMALLLWVGAIGYALALWTFQRRDLPAPL